MNPLPTIPLFPSGRLVATPGALELLDETNKSPLELLSRHLSGDWGDLCPEDKAENEFSLKNGLRILSSYQVSEAGIVWIITEADRSDHSTSPRRVLMLPFCKEIPSLSSSHSIANNLATDNSGRISNFPPF